MRPPLYQLSNTISLFENSLDIESISRLFIAAVLGGIVGLERDKHGRSAGLRTHLLVSMGAALFMILSTKIAGIEIPIKHGVSRLADPGRIAAQIVTGIGFLGAGVIMKEGVTVRGLTTASCLWMAAAIGMASGGGFYQLAITTTIFTLIALVFLRYIFVFYKRDSYRTLNLWLPIDSDINQIIDAIKIKSLSIRFFSVDKDYQNNICKLNIAIRIYHRGQTDQFSQEITQILEQSNFNIKRLSWSQA